MRSVRGAGRGDEAARTHDRISGRRIDVYDGIDHIGTLIQQGQAFRAEGSNGEVLGSFPDTKTATVSVITHHRAVRGARA